MWKNMTLYEFFLQYLETSIQSFNPTRVRVFGWLQRLNDSWTPTWSGRRLTICQGIVEQDRHSTGFMTAAGMLRVDAFRVANGKIWENVSRAMKVCLMLIKFERLCSMLRKCEQAEKVCPKFKKCVEISPRTSSPLKKCQNHLLNVIRYCLSNCTKVIKNISCYFVVLIKLLKWFALAMSNSIGFLSVFKWFTYFEGSRFKPWAILVVC